MERREVLKLFGALASLPLAGVRGAERPASGAARGAIGLQLYTVRSLMARDVEGTLAAVAEIGYREVELAGLFGLTAKAMRALLDRNGLAAPSSHISLDDVRHRWAATLDDAAALGQQFIVCPWIDESERTVDGYKRVAAELNGAADTARRAGIQLCYHNHDYEFAPIGGVRPYDLLLTECDPTLVGMELDLYWIVKAGGDPLRYFAGYPGRFPLLHVKDMARDGSMVDVGAGTIDFRAIFAHAAQVCRLPAGADK